MNTNLFYGCNRPDEIEQRYQELSGIFKDQEEVLISLKEEYSTLMSVLSSAGQADAKEKATVSEKIRQLQEKIDPEGLHLEICGTWLWVTGKTYPVKDTLKELGFRYSSNKLSWYYRQEDNRSSNQEPIPLEMIREKYGSSEVAMK